MPSTATDLHSDGDCGLLQCVHQHAFLPGRAQVCQRATDPRVRFVVLLNYSQRGLVAEALHGSVGSHLSRHCAKPLLLLQLPE